MSLKEVTELLKDLIESNKQLTLRLKMIEIEINYIKENLPGRITKIIEKTEQFDKKVSQKYIKELLSKKLASGSTYKPSLAFINLSSDRFITIGQLIPSLKVDLTNIWIPPNVSNSIIGISKFRAVQNRVAEFLCSKNCIMF